MNNISYAFIIGNPRSGTSMFRMMLNSHSQMIIPPECGFSHWLSGKYGKLSEYDDIVYIDFVRDVHQSKKFETWGVTDRSLLDLIRRYKPDSYESLVKCVYLSYSQYNKEVKIVGDKNNYYINHLPDIKSLFPNAKFIHLVRDGRDVACSYRNMKNIKTDSVYKPLLPMGISEIAREWRDNNLGVINGLGGDVYSLRYEDLISSPETELVKVCEYLGVKFESDMLRFYDNNDEPNGLIDWKDKTKYEVDSANMGKYLDILSLSEVKEFNLIADVVLRKYKYI